jgi:hypothetical protein
MKTIPYSEVFDLFCELAGVGASAVGAELRATFNRLGNAWARRGWEWYWWPDLMRNVPVRVDEGGVVAFRSEYGDLLAVYAADPLSGAAPERFEFEHDCLRTRLHAGTAWLRLRLPCPRWAGEALPAVPAAGRIYYFEGTGGGDFFRAGAGVAAGETPAGAPAAFLKIEFPAFLAGFTARGAYCDFMRGEGQQGKALAEALMPWDFLYDELDKLELQRARVRRWRYFS